MKMPHWAAPEMHAAQVRAIMLEGYARAEAERLLVRLGIERGTRDASGRLIETEEAGEWTGT